MLHEGTGCLVCEMWEDEEKEGKRGCSGTEG